MVMILSATDDYSTNDVIDWLRYYKTLFVRISVDDKITYKKVILNNSEFDVEFLIYDVNYKLSDFTAFWYRRSSFTIFFNKIFEKDEITRQINRHLQIEANEIHKVFTNYIKKRSINKIEDINTNKLQILKKASDLGIKIPDTLVTNSKKDTASFLLKHNKIITKNFSQGVFISDKDKSFSSTTKIVTERVYEMLPKNFSYTLFQECVEKLFELRIFFLKGKFYSSAIFSQNDPQTAVDFRNYNWETPNRTPPFELPNNIKKQLLKLMDIVDLNSGSIDMIVTTNNEYVFLEVNPIGQFGQVSIPGNYFLEEKIAKELKNIATHGN